LGKNNVVPGCSDRVDYMMMRRFKKAYYIDNAHETTAEESADLLVNRFTIGE